MAVEEELVRPESRECVERAELGLIVGSKGMGRQWEKKGDLSECSYT
jgi:hypothetical protein